MSDLQSSLTEAEKRIGKRVNAAKEKLASAEVELTSIRQAMTTALTAAQERFEASGSSEDAAALALQERTGDLTIARAESALKKAQKAVRDVEAVRAAELLALRQGFAQAVPSDVLDVLARMRLETLQRDVEAVSCGCSGLPSAALERAVAARVNSKLASIRQWIAFEDACKTARAAELGPRDEIVQRFARELERRLPREIPPLDPSHSITFGPDALARMHPSEREKVEALRRSAQANFDRWTKRIEGIRSKIEREKDAALAAYDAAPLANPPTQPSCARPEHLDAWRLVLSPEPAAPPPERRRIRQIPSNWSPDEVLARRVAHWAPDEVAE